MSVGEDQSSSQRFAMKTIGARHGVAREDKVDPESRSNVQSCWMFSEVRTVAQVLPIG